MKRLGLGLAACLGMGAAFSGVPRPLEFDQYMGEINYRPRAKKKPNKVSQAKRRKYARQGRK